MFTKQPYEEYSFDHSTFSCCTLAAQEYIPTCGREPMRGELLVYPTAREAAEADGSDNKYFTRLTEWTQKGNSFTTDFTVPFAWANRQVLLRIGWASADYEIRINGGTVAYNSDCNARPNSTSRAMPKRGVTHWRSFSVPRRRSQGSKAGK